MRKLLCFTLLIVLATPVSQAKVTSYTGEAVVRSIDTTRVAVFLDTEGPWVRFLGILGLIGSALMHSAGESGCDIQQAHEKDANVCYAYGRE